MSQLVKIVKVKTNSSMALKRSFGILSCGHSCEIVFIAQVATCRGCSHVFPVSLDTKDCPSCDSAAWRITFRPDRHNDEHIVSKIGDEIECLTCEQNERSLQEMRDLDWSQVSHTRFRPNGSEVGTISVYARDEKSPSGVRLCLSMEATAAAVALARQHSHDPFSPTEGRVRR